MAAVRRAPWLVIVATALLTALLTLTLDRSLTALLAPSATPTSVPTAQPVVVILPTPEPEPVYTTLPISETQQQLDQVRRRSDLHLAFTFVDVAQDQVTLALEALASNDVARADRELVAALASLDNAFNLVPEDLKPQVDAERLELGRIRANLVINPRSLDEALRQMRDRLLSLIAVPLP